MLNLKNSFILCLSLVLGACAQVPKGGFYDVVLYVKPVSVEPIRDDTAMDVIEGEGVDLLDSAVKFRVIRVLEGEFSQKRGGPSTLSQMARAAGDKDLWKLVSFDYEDPNEVVEKPWVVVGVRDPMQTFGFLDANHGGKYKLYLKRSPDVSNSYTLMNVKLKS